MKIQEYFKDIDENTYPYYTIRKEYHSRDGLEYEELYKVNEYTIKLLHWHDVYDVVKSDRDGYLVVVRLIEK